MIDFLFEIKFCLKCMIGRFLSPHFNQDIIEYVSIISCHSSLEFQYDVMTKTWLPNKPQQGKAPTLFNSKRNKDLIKGPLPLLNSLDSPVKNGLRNKLSPFICEL